MNRPVFRRMTADAFLEWDSGQPDARHELIDAPPNWVHVVFAGLEAIIELPVRGIAFPGAA